MGKPRNILLMMSGSIACAKAVGLVSEWVRRGHSVRVACTPSVRHFVGSATLEGLSGHPVFDDTFESGRAMDHITLARWANLIVVCPATANLINRLAAGLANDAVTTLWQAAWGRGVPQFIVPAMNARMWDYPATQESVGRLREWGVQVLPPAHGDLACGERGTGRMLECSEILSQIERRLVPGDAVLRGGRILLTAGGTREPIDAVRYIGNASTGRTGAELTDELAAAGHEVIWLGSRHALRPRRAERLETFETFSELDEQMRRLLGSERFDLAVHAAAVSDFSVAPTERSDPANPHAKKKLPSGRELSLKLVPNPKLLDRIREYSANPQIRVVAFKLTAGADASQVSRAVDKLFRRAAPDAVVHNDMTDIGEHRHTYSLHRAGEPPLLLGDSRELAHAIGQLLEIRGEHREPVSGHR